jgi:hypothetical protein
MLLLLVLVACVTAIVALSSAIDAMYQDVVDIF